MYRFMMLSEQYTEERLDLAIKLRGICKRHPDVSTSQLADIIFSSIDTSKYQVAAFPSKKKVSIYQGKMAIARVMQCEKVKEVQNA